MTGDKIHCDFFHGTDGKCCPNRPSCLLARRRTAIDTAPLHEAMTMRQFLMLIGFSALIFVFALGAVAGYNARQTTTMVTHELFHLSAD
ncbi:hypothetical protein EVC02_011 [Rhizobium phage RHph_N17]|nr:hypothetical protein EVC02_011 [Rhizobium phage RHph_N17]